MTFMNRAIRTLGGTLSWTDDEGNACQVSAVLQPMGDKEREEYAHALGTVSGERYLCFVTPEVDEEALTGRKLGFEGRFYRTVNSQTYYFRGQPNHIRLVLAPWEEEAP